MLDGLDRLTQRGLLPLTVGGLVLGLLLAAAGQGGPRDLAWAVPSVLVAGWLAITIVRDLLRHEAGVDVIAVLAIAGAVLFGEYLAAAVIGVMLATGDWLERFAAGRAHRELSALVSRAPRTVHRYETETIVDRPIAEVAVGDRLIVKPGEVVPVDGTVTNGSAVLDESALTGEARLATRLAGDPVSSGTVNAGAPFDLTATATSERSTYAGIVRLVNEAQSSKAPFVRLADRYALLFVPLTLVLSGAAWLFSGDPVRALAVLVVATPCPLLLAVPIAIVAGISRAARRGIIVKGGGALEAIARARVMLFDKTGTLTAGRPRLADVVVAPGWTAEAVLGLAASLEQVSPHVLAASIVGGARDRGVILRLPDGAIEEPGAGISGTIDGVAVVVGTPEFTRAGASLPAWARDVRRRVSLEGATSVFVAADGVLVGALILDDPVRPETPRVIRSLRRAGVRRTVMVTGDQYGVADMVAAAIGVDAVLAERTPSDKVDAVAEERVEARGILVMIGDGINDAPALAAADVGVAMGARGATASSEAADIVITVDRLDRLPEAIRIAKRSRSIAIQSVVAGMGMSLAAMLVATTGVLPPVAGALLQEGIDVDRHPQRAPGPAGRARAEAGDPGLDGHQRAPSRRAPGARALHRPDPIARRRARRHAVPRRRVADWRRPACSCSRRCCPTKSGRIARSSRSWLARSATTMSRPRSTGRTPRSSTWSGSPTGSSRSCPTRARRPRTSPISGVSSTASTRSCGSTWPRRKSCTSPSGTSTPPRPRLPAPPPERVRSRWAVTALRNRVPSGP